MMGTPAVAAGTFARAVAYQKRLADLFAEVDRMAKEIETLKRYLSNNEASNIKPKLQRAGQRLAHRSTPASHFLPGSGKITDISSSVSTSRGEPVIDALAENVVSTVRGTVVGKGAATVSTIERMQWPPSTLRASTTASSRVDGPGNSHSRRQRGSVRGKILECGTVEQDADKDFYYVKHKVEVVDPATGSKLMLLPDDQFSVDVKIDFDSPVLSNQYPPQWTPWPTSRRKSLLHAPSCSCVK